MSQLTSVAARVCVLATLATVSLPPCARGVIRTTYAGSKPSSPTPGRESGSSTSPLPSTAGGPAMYSQNSTFCCSSSAGERVESMRKYIFSSSLP